jgi:hypothetical protein
VQEWPARFVELQRLATQWDVDAFGGRELVSVLKNARP